MQVLRQLHCDYSKQLINNENWTTVSYVFAGPGTTT
jgi:hypothetical protein